MRALMSVSDKTGIVEFAKGLTALGYDIVSTGGTLKTLEDANIQAIPIDDVTGFPEMLNGRVKTLHPKIHGGLLAVRDNDTHMTTCKEHDIQMIDLVVVNLYPFEATISKPNVTFDEAIENIDIGGPSMLRSGAKNYKSVGVVVDPKRYNDVLENLKANGGTLSQDLRSQLSCEAFTHTAEYDSLISNYLSKQQTSASATSINDDLPDTIQPVLEKVADLRYGENPHQKAAFYKVVGKSGIPGFKQLHGKELSYNNIMDLEAAALIVAEFNEPAASVIKHANPCGAAIADTLDEAYQKAHDADPVSAFGSIVGLNKQVDAKTATAISKTFVEVVVAPGFSDEAIEILTKKPSIRLIELSNIQDIGKNLYFKHIDGGFLVQTPDSMDVDQNAISIKTKRQPSDKEMKDLLFAFKLVKFVKSNAILIAKDGQAIGVGAGQMSRVEAMDIALKKAGEKAAGAVLASDAFFPFRDSIDLSHKSGISAVIQPGGSKRDDESIEACDEFNMTMVFTGVRHFRH